MSSHPTVEAIEIPGEPRASKEAASLALPAETPELELPDDAKSGPIMPQPKHDLQKPELIEYLRGVDLGFLCSTSGPVTLSNGEFRLWQLFREGSSFVAELWGWCVPLAFAAFPLLMIAAAALFLFIFYYWYISVPLLLFLLSFKVFDLLLRSPRCHGCRLPMSHTARWTRFVRSQAEFTLGYRDCMAALQEGLWQDAAELLNVHSSEPTSFFSTKLISTPVRYHLDYYECRLCAHHAARMTAYSVVDETWIPGMKFREAYQGERPVPVSTLSVLQSVVPRSVRAVASSIRYAEAIRLDARTIVLGSGALLMAIVVFGLSVWSDHVQRTNARALASGVSRAVSPAAANNAINAESEDVARGATSTLGAPQWQARYGLTAAQFKNSFSELVLQGYRPKCLSKYFSGGTDRYAALWVRNTGLAWEARYDLTSAEYQRAFNDLVHKRYRLTWINGYESGGLIKYAAIWEKRGDTPWVARHALSDEELRLVASTFTQQGYRPIQISGYESGGIPRYAAVWEKVPGPVWTARWGLSREQASQAWDLLTQQGYRLVDVSVYGADSARYAEIWELKRGAWFEYSGMSAAGLQTRLEDLEHKGYHPTELRGYNIGDRGFYEAVWEK